MAEEQTRTCQDMPPFESEGFAQDALDGFHKAVSEARQKFGIHHVFSLGCVAMRAEPDQNGERIHVAQTVQGLGSDAELLLQLAAAYGRLRENFEGMLNRALSRKKT